MKTYSDFFQQVTKQLFDIIDEKGSLLKWKKDWDVAVCAKLPISHSGYYKGANLFKLLLSQINHGFTHKKWLTFRQTQLQEARVLKGAKSEPVYFWKIVEKNKKVDGKNVIEETPIFKVYRVFNIDQTSLAATLDKTTNESKPVNLSIQQLIQKHHIDISTFGNQPRYNTKDNVIFMPKINYFNSEADYYATLLHEITHWSGHESRLNPLAKGKTKISKSYAKE